MATARDDGDLRVTSGKELYHKLNRGITLLKDGAISGNGKWAATLSYESFSDLRKIQYWNLDAKIKEKELFCPQSISAMAWTKRLKNGKLYTTDSMTGAQRRSRME